MNPYQPVIDFENVLAEYSGSKYAVAVESCTAAIFLSLMYRKQSGWRGSEKNGIGIPKHTYPDLSKFKIYTQ